MSRTRIRVPFLVLLAAGLSAAEPAPPALPFPTGTIVEKVQCRSAPDQSYALYLPKSYDPARRWPALYVFDPRSRGAVAAEVFREGAERYGWLVVSSNNSTSDGPMAPNLAALQAMWADTRVRLPLDERRVYATGFSGGARAACLMARVLPDTVHGVIGNAGGFPFDWKPSKEVRFAFFGLTGYRDFNWYELHDLDRTLAGLGLRHRLRVFDGEHEWAPAESMTEAMGWMELLAMREGRRPKDPALIDALHTQALRRAAADEAAGRLIEAERRYADLAEDFDGFADAAQARQKAEALRGSKPYQKLSKEREHLAERDAAYRTKSQEVLELALGSGDLMPLPKILSELRISRLQKEARDEPGSEAGLSASRLLETIYVQAAFYVPRAYFQQKDYRRAALTLSIATAIHPDHPAPWYDLACAQARLGRKDDAIESLGKAVEAGYSDLGQLQQDADLEALRSEPGYAKLVQRLSGQGG